MSCISGAAIVFIFLVKSQLAYILHIQVIHYMLPIQHAVKCRNHLSNNSKYNQHNRETYSSLESKQIKQGMDFICIKQAIYPISNHSDSVNHSDYRWLGAKMSFASNTRPPLCCFVAKLVQVIKKGFENDKLSRIKESSKNFRHLLSDVHFTIIFPELGNT